MNIHISKLSLLLGILLFSSILLAKENMQLKNEINHLLDFVKHTDCMIERNGQRYNGQQAVEHIQLKYNYFLNKINTSEQFIEYSATRSTFSNKMYLSFCGDDDVIHTSDWLLNELKKYRLKAEPEKPINHTLKP